MLLRPLCLPLNISQWQKVSPRAKRLYECGSRAARSDIFEGWRTWRRTAEAEAEPVVHSCQCILAIPHLSGWTNRLSELTSPWERPTASLIHISHFSAVSPHSSNMLPHSGGTPSQSCFCVSSLWLSLLSSGKICSR